ncbi:hypothetical protein E2C05_26395 [Paracraurococcus ruber]|nr:hypothetical protein E2C05_26395 [Paracraurococcus ruber]
MPAPREQGRRRHGASSARTHPVPYPSGIPARRGFLRGWRTAAAAEARHRAGAHHLPVRGHGQQPGLGPRRPAPAPARRPRLGRGGGHGPVRRPAADAARPADPACAAGRPAAARC